MHRPLARVDRVRFTERMKIEKVNYGSYYAKYISYGYEVLFFKISKALF